MRVAGESPGPSGLQSGAPAHADLQDGPGNSGRPPGREGRPVGDRQCSRTQKNGLLNIMNIIGGTGETAQVS
jgi:hypothetical protein